MLRHPVSIGVCALDLLRELTFRDARNADGGLLLALGHASALGNFTSRNQKAVTVLLILTGPAVAATLRLNLLQQLARPAHGARGDAVAPQGDLRGAHARQKVRGEARHGPPLPRESGSSAGTDGLG